MDTVLIKVVDCPSSSSIRTVRLKKEEKHRSSINKLSLKKSATQARIQSPIIDDSTHLTETKYMRVPVTRYSTRSFQK